MTNCDFDKFRLNLLKSILAIELIDKDNNKIEKCDENISYLIDYLLSEYSNSKEEIYELIEIFTNSNSFEEVIEKINKNDYFREIINKKYSKEHSNENTRLCKTLIILILFIFLIVLIKVI